MEKLYDADRGGRGYYHSPFPFDEDLAYQLSLDAARVNAVVGRQAITGTREGVGERAKARLWPRIGTYSRPAPFPRETLALCASRKDGSAAHFANIKPASLIELELEELQDGGKNETTDFNYAELSA